MRITLKTKRIPACLANFPAMESRRPTLDEYRARWKERRDWHARVVEPQQFSRDNLVPKPIPRLWQDAPHVPFDKLLSDEAQARLSICRLTSCVEPAGLVDGTPSYASVTGGFRHSRRFPLDLSSTLAFTLSRGDDAVFLGKLKPAATDALHECLNWLRDDSDGHGANNPIHMRFATIHEAFANACEKFRSLLPEGNHRMRIRQAGAIMR